MPGDDPIRLTLTFTRETDLALRAYVGAQGVRTGAMSKFIEEAVRWRIFDRTLQAVKASNVDVDFVDLNAAIDESCTAVRNEMWPTEPSAPNR
jgi:hypothetical protein